MKASRRNLLIGAAALGMAGVLSAVFLNSGSAYPMTKLDSTTLTQYPDKPETIKGLMQSGKFKGKYVMVDYVAGWCPYCARLRPEMDKAMKDLHGKRSDVARIEVIIQEGDYRTHTRGQMAYINTFQAMNEGSGGIPYVELWKDGQKLDNFTGARPASDIEQFFAETVKRGAPAPKVAPAAKPD